MEEIANALQSLQPQADRIRAIGAEHVALRSRAADMQSQLAAVESAAEAGRRVFLASLAAEDLERVIVLESRAQAVRGVMDRIGPVLRDQGHANRLLGERFGEKCARSPLTLSRPCGIA